MDGYRSDEDIFSTDKKECDIRRGTNGGVMCQKIEMIRSLLSGIPPPPEKTNPDYNLMNVLAKYENGKENYSWSKGNPGDDKSLGLSLNLDNSCEEWERLLQKFASRYVSNETFSYTSHRVFMSESAKKRKNGWNSSPRTRINYLSKRRKTFQVVNSSRNTILVDESSLKRPRRSLFTGEEKCETPLSGRSFPRVKSEGAISKKFHMTEKKKCSRSLFETNDPQILTKQHKQKLLWAVSMALRERGMTSEDGNFKEEASKLFASTRSSWVNRKGDTAKSSTSDRMLEFARKIAEELNIGTTVKENESPRKRSRDDYEKNSPSKRTPLSLNVLIISPQKKRAKTITLSNS